ncbi:MAG: hypothetical protein PHU85_06585 [Phycisphaerae bacterium]|nr:hypothetical protein [Phycisphaerae bacterium]
MLTDLPEQIEVELEELEELAGVVQPLVQKLLEGGSPSIFEVMAMGAVLHSFYNGLENAFKRALKEFKEPMPQGESWHQELLRAATRPGPSRPVVISPTTASQLIPYLRFRHRFRNMYSSNLEWSEMEHLVTGFLAMHKTVVQELNQFLDDIRKIIPESNA